MSEVVLSRAFAKMGARVEFGDNDFWSRTNLSLNIGRDREGEYFFVRHNPDVVLEVLDVQPKDRHLLLLSRENGKKHRYLLGHDERHWFVAGIPESTPVSTVRDAKQALKPEAVHASELGVGSKHRNRRRNAVLVRQGEWFFVRRPGMVIDPKLILKKEPLRRSNSSKPHVCEELYRSGGETVYVATSFPEGLTEGQYLALDKKVRESRNWQMMKRNPSVWVRGTVRHSDHATIRLGCWHQVFSNTENLSYAMRYIQFLD